MVWVVRLSPGRIADPGFSAHLGDGRDVLMAFAADVRLIMNDPLTNSCLKK
jgi:hypothetical protein